MQKIHMGAWVSRQFATQDSFGAVVHACMWVANFGYLGTPMGKTVSDLCKFNHSPCGIARKTTLALSSTAISLVERLHLEWVEGSS